MTPRTLSPRNGYVAQRLAELFWVTFWWAALVFIIVQGLLLFAMIKFRRRSDATDVPTQVHGNTRFEIGWTILPDADPRGRRRARRRRPCSSWKIPRRRR